MNAAPGIIAASGVVTFLANFKEQGGYPVKQAPAIMVGTILLMILASFASKTPLAEPVKWLAILMLITAVIRWVPALSNPAPTSKKR